ncbi:cytochrome P450 [Acidiphilium sp. PA]|uniref:cytochrome P450 n=1 Tax=Acidiphilium sp. PA TaxID=2871705 RepID=UPI002243C9AC|nr:cytochrome P450 [Acidiphilium sp. PA]MCW8305888.1 cytochrome P450 [Acidiphilium sp. PA]
MTDKGGAQRLIRTNPLGLWPDSAYDEMVVRQAFSGRSLILVNAPDMIRHVLITRHDIYRRTSAATRLLRPLIGRGLLLSEGRLWRHQRHLIAPTLAPRSIPTLMVPAARAIDAWREALAALQAPIDLLQSLQGLALEVACQSMFSLSAVPFAREVRALIGSATIINLSKPDYLDMMLPAQMPAPRDFRRWWFQRRWMGLISRMIAARQAAPPGGAPRDLFDLLRAASDGDGGGGKRQLRDEVATMIIAGHETTALTLFWACVLVADHPEAQARLAAEAATLDLAGGGADLAAALERMVFTRAVVNETLRLYPPAAMITRRAMIADRCASVAVPKGATVMVAPWVLHRHRSLWRDPERFDPARFLPDAPGYDRFAYLPFGAGPRVCVGAQFALAESSLALAALMQRFAISRLDSDPVEAVVVLTTHPNRAPLFRLIPR